MFRPIGENCESDAFNVLFLFQAIKKPRAEASGGRFRGGEAYRWYFPMFLFVTVI